MQELATFYREWWIHIVYLLVIFIGLWGYSHIIIEEVWSCIQQS